MKVVVVGFKLAEEDSVYYRKWHVLMDGDKIAHGFGVDESLGALLVNAFEKGADFVSVRFIRTEPENELSKDVTKIRTAHYHDLLNDIQITDPTKVGGIFGQKELDEAREKLKKDPTLAGYITFTVDDREEHRK